MLTTREKRKRDGEFSFLELESEGEIYILCQKWNKVMITWNFQEDKMLFAQKVI